MATLPNFPAIRPSLLLDFANSRRADPRLSVVRATTGTITNAAGQLELVPANSPRTDFDPVTGQCLGMLVEEQRSNLLLNSAAPATQSVTVTAQSYTLSIYGSGSVAISGAYTGVLNGSGSSINRTSLTFTPSAGSITLTPSGIGSNWQLEAGSFPTSYIPTTSAQVTRAADSPSLVIQPSVFGVDEGSIVCRFRQSGVSNPSPKVFRMRTNTPYDWYIEVNSSDQGGIVIMQLWENNAYTVATGSKSWGRSGDSNTVAVSWKGRNLIFACGGQLQEYTSVTPLNWQSLTLHLGKDQGTSRMLNGWIERMPLYSRQLTAAQLSLLTA